MATVHRGPDGSSVVAVKGDPSAVLPLCGWRSEKGEMRGIDDAARAAIEADNLAMAEAGLRVLGVAFKRVPEGESVGSPATDLVWLGLVGMADPLRPGAAELVRALRRAGIAMVMLTGDQRATALAIATEVGLANGNAQVIEGDRLDDQPIAAADQHIFARLTPAQKLEVIAALQRSGARVAMIGDGVNDTPALKIADVGITLAASATEIARGVADIVLAGDDLSPIALAFERGRSVHVNIRRATRYLIRDRIGASVEPGPAVVDQSVDRCPARDGAGARTAGSRADERAAARHFEPGRVASRYRLTGPGCRAACRRRAGGPVLGRPAPRTRDRRNGRLQ
jgi:Ca2+-transporting ATPase